RQAIAGEHEAVVHEVVLVPPGGVPRTTSGKVQRRACRDLYLQGELRAVSRSRLSTAAADDVEDLAADLPGSEDWLRRTFAAVARIDAAGIDPDRPLTAFGLDSLAAIEWKHAVEAGTGVSLPITDLLDGMTLAEAARRVAGGTESAEGETAEPEGAETGEHPLSWGQRSLWFLYRLAPESAAYNIAGAARLVGVDAEALHRALAGLVDRHPALRATFSAVSGEPVQRIAGRAEAAFTRVDAAGWSGEEVRRRLHEEAFRPFDLETGPVLRAALLTRGGEAFFVLAVHHIAADFWSMAVLAEELGALLAGEAPPRPAALYTGHARRQERLLAGPRGERLWEHWRERLSGAPPLDLPTDRPRPPVRTFRGGTALSMPSPEREAARRIAAAHGVTPYVALLAAFQALLARWSGQEDFVTGSPTAGRSAPGFERVVGYFVNPVPLRAGLSGDPAAGELLARTRATVLDALEHQDLPFALLAERLQPERDPSRPPLVETMLTLQRAPAPDLTALGAFALGVPGARLRVGGLTLESVPLDPPAAQLDLSLMIAELEGGLAASLQWNADLFDGVTAERMLDGFDRLLAGMAEAPERPVWEIGLLSAAERGQLAAPGAVEFPRESSIDGLFEEQAGRSPGRIAVEAEGDLALTYAELNARANRLAHHLRALGLAPEDPVGVALERSPEMIVSFLAVLKAGGAYVPLDPAYPRDRLALMMEEAAVPLLITEERLLRALPGSLPASVVLLDREREAIAVRSAADPGSRSAAGGLAYAMFTSGSTGRPKAVGVAHRAVVRLVRGADYADLGPEQVFLQLAPAAFDAATLEIWGPLLNGGRLALPPPGPPSLDALETAIARHGVTTLWLTAGLFHEVVESRIEALRPVRQLLAGGDVLSPEAVNRVLAELPGCALINGYGPTENTTFTCCHRVREPVPPGGSVPIGRPIANTRVHVLDRRLQPVPPGVPGELFAGGDGLARGYLRRPELTAERFVPSPFAGRGDEPGARLYRTGDRVRRLPDGTLEFLGRIDDQVKIRGFRVEPGEVEAALAAHEAVTAAAVLIREAASGSRSLAAYVALSGPADLRSWLKDRLPAYMVPASIAVLPSLPLNTNGKVDRRALARLAAPEASEGGSAPPRTPTEELLAGIWAGLLGVGRVGAEDDFFALGGHSLLALRLASRLGETFGAEVPLVEVFESPTLAALAAAVDRARGTGAEAAGPIVAVSRAAALPLSFAQERLWFLDRLAPGLPLYSLPVALRLAGGLDAAALSRALGEIARRHEALRTAFPEVAGRPVQEVRPEGLTLAWIDLSALPAPAREEEARRLTVSEARRPFDLSRGPLARTALLRLGESEHRLVLNLHHTVADGWSIGVFARELAALYEAFSRGLPSPLPELPVQYADYAAWQRSRLDGDTLTAELSWWRETLAGAPAALDLTTDRPRPAVQSFRGAAEPADLPDGPELSALARRGGATRFMTLVSGLAALLYRYTGQTDLVLGSVFAGRSRPEVQGLIGLFVNALPLRADLAGDPGFAGLLAQVRGAVLGAYAHQDLPLERLVQEMQPQRDLSRSPLFQVVFVLQDEGVEALRLPGVETSPEPLHTGTAKFDLTLSLAASGGRLRGQLELAAGLFDPATGRRLLAHLENLLAAAAADPDRPVSQLAILSAAERSHLLTAWNPAGEAQPDPVPLHRRFAAEAARRPEAPAVTCGEVTWTYG
ncbi:MAG TPA: amino acid adenylation domain-containing protein, partial [Thermoanaerobaculia bacterium]|nr:amino acid adenylation domain-containing protein [Thermoanaerobaculia bacterium]